MSGLAVAINVIAGILGIAALVLMILAFGEDDPS